MQSSVSLRKKCIQRLFLSQLARNTFVTDKQTDHPGIFGGQTFGDRIIMAVQISLKFATPLSVFAS